MQPVQSLRLHIGAHKTATTHLQEVLKNHRDLLAAEGVDYLPMEQIRPLQILGRRYSKRQPVRRQLEKFLSTEKRVQSLRLGPPAIVISEENLIGLMEDSFQPRLYHRAEQRIRRLIARTKTRNISCFIAVRRYDEFVPSAYAQLLKRRPVSGGFERIRGCIESPTWGYLDLVNRLYQLHPFVDFKVWCAEDYRHHQNAILSQLCGVPCDFGNQVAPPKKTQRPTVQAIRMMEQIGITSREERQERTRDAISSHEGGDRYMPFSDLERQQLEVRYKKDLAAIDRAFPGILMRF